MEDGSLQYLSDHDETINTGDFTNVKKIDIKGVVKFYTASSRKKGSHYGGVAITLAQTLD